MIIIIAIIINMAEGRSSSPRHSPPSPLPMASPDDNSEGDIVSREREDDYNDEPPPLKRKKGDNRGDIVWVQEG